MYASNKMPTMFRKKLIVMTKFPDIGQMAKIPWHFFKIPWQFPDLEKILFFPDFSLTRDNPVMDRMT